MTHLHVNRSIGTTALFTGTARDAWNFEISPPISGIVHIGMSSNILKLQIPSFQNLANSPKTMEARSERFIGNIYISGYLLVLPRDTRFFPFSSKCTTKKILRSVLSYYAQYTKRVRIFPLRGSPYYIVYDVARFPCFYDVKNSLFVDTNRVRGFFFVCATNTRSHFFSCILRFCKQTSFMSVREVCIYMFRRFRFWNARLLVRFGQWLIRME